MNIENTTRKDLGVKNKQLAVLSKKPNCVSSQTDSPAKKVREISYTLSLKEQMAKVVDTLSAMPGTHIKQRSDNYLYAVFTTKLMRFKDDVEIYLDDDAKLIHFRSASRVGYSDLGVNRKRYDPFVAGLES